MITTARAVTPVITADHMAPVAQMDRFGLPRRPGFRTFLVFPTFCGKRRLDRRWQFMPAEVANNSVVLVLFPAGWTNLHGTCSLRNLSLIIIYQIRSIPPCNIVIKGIIQRTPSPLLQTGVPFGLEAGGNGNFIFDKA